VSRAFFQTNLETLVANLIPPQTMGCFGSKYKLSKPDLQFLIENTEFTKEQIEVWYSGFIVDCPNGELSKAKFIEVYQQLFPQGNAQKFCSHIFRTFDTDNSGKIDFK
jgi:Ca2+-binding EF-hand superfamily protein